jgi:hypothetical protein
MGLSVRYVVDMKSTMIKRVLEGLPLDDRRLAGLSAHIRQWNFAGESPVWLTTSWDTFAASHLHTSVTTKLRRVLEHLADLTRQPDDGVEINGSLDYPVFDAASSSEVGYLVHTLVEQGDLKRNPGGPVLITAQGWARLESTGRGSGTPRTCFVAMSFRPEMHAAYDAQARR